MLRLNTELCHKRLVNSYGLKVFFVIWKYPIVHPCLLYATTRCTSPPILSSMNALNISKLIVLMFKPKSNLRLFKQCLLAVMINWWTCLPRHWPMLNLSVCIDACMDVCMDASIPVSSEGGNKCANLLCPRIPLVAPFLSNKQLRCILLYPLFLTLTLRTKGNVCVCSMLAYVAVCNGDLHFLTSHRNYKKKTFNLQHVPILSSFAFHVSETINQGSTFPTRYYCFYFYKTRLHMLN